MLFTPKEITYIYISGKVIGAVYRGSKVIWEGIRSCFGGGAWLNLKAWQNTDGWKN